jgi:hypothetical protein
LDFFRVGKRGFWGGGVLRIWMDGWMELAGVLRWRCGLGGGGGLKREGGVGDKTCIVEIVY